MNEIINRLDFSINRDNLKIMVVYESENSDDSRILKDFNEKGYLTYLSPPNYLKLWPEL